MEEAMVRAFIAPHRRPRWLSALGSAKRRGAFLDCLNHCGDLDPRYAQPVPPGASVVSLLRSLGAPATCHVVSCTNALDDRVMPLEEAVAAVGAAGWGTIITCVPGQLGCYLDEAGTGRRLLLVRPPAEPGGAPDT